MFRYYSQVAAPTGHGNLCRSIHWAVVLTATILTGNSMAGQVQTILMDPLAAKTYGDAPFTVTATASSGLPITKWESSDPSVASVSSGGLVTLRGAGQTSIIASNIGNATYNSAWIAQPLNVARSLSPLPSGTQTVTYNGSAQSIDPSAFPSGQATAFSYRNASLVEPAATPQVVFQNGPDTLALSYGSSGLQAVGYWGMAKYISLGGAARKLDSCDVTLVSHARYDTSSPYGYQVWANAHPDLVVAPTPGVSIPGDSGGYYHPVTLSFYDYENVGGTETYRILTSQTVQAFIPWRPSTLADGVTAYVVNGQPATGYAFRVPFSFPDGVVLPQDVWVAVGFNTSTYGAAPIGATGPYDSLNISKPNGAQLAGSTLFPAYTLLYKDWRWQNTTASNGAPMLRLRTIPATATPNAPSNAGIYEVRTKATAFGTDPWATSMLEINKAPLEVNLSNLVQIRDGAPKPITVGTIPSGIATNVTYAGLAVAPSALGTYPVTGISANPNYVGLANGNLQIGDSFSSWQTAIFAGSGLPPEKIADSADPDGDGLSNLLEYAANLNPLTGESPSPVGFEYGSSTLVFTYRRNFHALDLDFAIQDSSALDAPESWGVVAPLSESTTSDGGSARVIRAIMATPVDVSHYFMRLRVRR